MSRFIQQILSTESIDTEQAQELVDYAQSIDEQTLMDDFQEESYQFPKQLLSILLDGLSNRNELDDEFEMILSSILQYFVITTGTASFSSADRLGCFYSNATELFNILQKMKDTFNLFTSENVAIRFLVVSFLNSLLVVKWTGLKPEDYQKHVSSLQQRAFNKNEKLQDLLCSIAESLLAYLEVEDFTALVVNVILGVHQILPTTEKKHLFIDKHLAADYETSKILADRFLAQFNYLTVDEHSSLLFIQSVMNLQNQRSDVNLFLTIDINFLIDVILREEEKWSETIFGQHEKDLQKSNVLAMFGIRLAYLKTLNVITKSKLYLEGKGTRDVHRKDDISKLMRSILNEREPNNAPKQFFTLKEEALDIMDNSVFIK